MACFDVPTWRLGRAAFRRTVLLALFCLSFAADRVAGEELDRSQQELVVSDGPLWTQNDNHIPMCWHQLFQFPNTSAANDAKAFVVRTIEDSWISLLNLRISWTNCPTSGNAKHVRIMLRTGDPFENGTTLKAGTNTLSTAAERLVPPPNDAPGLLMGFPANWNQNDATRASFRALIRHEFGHILGFDHEHARPDGAPNVTCYDGSLPSAITLGPPDPTSIMGWSYCAEALGTLSAADVEAARSVYGIGGVTADACPSVSAGCAVTETTARLLLLR
jgi:hypothetical protein